MKNRKKFINISNIFAVLSILEMIGFLIGYTFAIYLILPTIILTIVFSILAKSYFSSAIWILNFIIWISFLKGINNQKEIITDEVIEVPIEKTYKL